MDKKLKKIFICIIIIICMGGCKKDNQEINIKDEKSDYEKIVSNGIKFECDDLINNEVLYLSNNYMVLSNNKLYKVILEKGKKFSNNEQCKEIPIDESLNISLSNLKDIIFDNSRLPFFLDKNNEVYTVDNDIVKKYNDISEKNNNSNFIKQLLLNNKNKKVIVSNIHHNFLTLEDYNIYMYNIPDSNKNIDWIDRQVILDIRDEYGLIYNFGYCDRYDCYLQNFTIININTLIQGKVGYILTSTGLYNYETIKTEECQKYEDVICDNDYVKKDKYEIIKDDIKYFDNNIILLNDNTIISVYYIIH